MKKLIGCALAIMAAATIATVAHAEMKNIWTTTLFGQVGQVKARVLPPDSKLQSLVTLTTDRDASVNNLFVVLDKQSKITGLLGRESGNSTSEENHFALEQIESKDGAVLAVVSGRNALILQGGLNRQTQEGRFQIKYLANGLFMSYKSCDFLLKKDAAGNSYVQNAYTNARVDRVHVISHNLGITTLQGICPK